MVGRVVVNLHHGMQIYYDNYCAIGADGLLRSDRTKLIMFLRNSLRFFLVEFFMGI